MAQAYFSGPTLDDVLHEVVQEAIDHGVLIHPTKGDAKDLPGVLLEIANPRARLSRTETRGRLYSCIGELCWYLSATKKLSFIEYYVADYKNYADGDEIFGGYGPRLFNWEGVNQVANVTAILRKNRDSRKAVIQLFDADDILEKHNDVPCTCTLQFLVRDGKLHMFTNMRSNDIHLGLPHDTFCFTMLQEIVARSLAIEVGTYKHAVGSLHLYVKDIPAAKKFLKEGFQPTHPTMPAMPEGDPWPAINLLLKAEAAIRETRSFDRDGTKDLPPYWADIIRLLQVFHAAKKAKDAEAIKALRNEMSSDIYFSFIDRTLGQLEAKKL